MRPARSVGDHVQLSKSSRLPGHINSRDLATLQSEHYKRLDFLEAPVGPYFKACSK